MSSYSSESNTNEKETVKLSLLGLVHRGGLVGYVIDQPEIKINRLFVLG